VKQQYQYAPTPGLKLSFLSQGEGILGSYLRETGQEPGITVVTFSAIRDHFGDRLSPDDQTCIKRYLIWGANRSDAGGRRTTAGFKIARVYRGKNGKEQQYQIDWHIPRSERAAKRAATPPRCL